MKLRLRLVRALFAGLAWVVPIIVGFSEEGGATERPLHQYYVYQKFHAFCKRFGGCSDDREPESAIVLDGAGDLFGTTIGGGGGDAGVIYEISLDGKARKFQDIYRFHCEKDGACPKGAELYGDLIMDDSGNLYGTTLRGGKWNEGTVFELSPGNPWILKTLYDFCPEGNGCSDGDQPDTGLTYAGAAEGRLYDGKSPLYGATYLGGANNWGTLYELQLSKRGKQRTESVLHSFCSMKNCADGFSPIATPVMDATGTIFGTTETGQYAIGGVVYELSPSPTTDTWTLAVVHTFSDGDGTPQNLVLDPSGNLYGLEQKGGKSNFGYFFELIRSGAHWRFRSSYSFCTRTCEDGKYPFRLARASDGDFVGVDSLGGEAGSGTAFELRRNGTKWKLSVLYPFCSQPKCADGSAANSLTPALGGEIYGNTESGGAGNEGVVFELTPR